MAKAIFKPFEVNNLKEAMLIGKLEEEEIEEVDSLPESTDYEGPSAEELMLEAESFKKNWEIEKAELLEVAQKEAEAIIKNAEDHAFKEISKKTEQAQKIKQDSIEEANKIMADAEERVKILESEIATKIEAAEKEAYKKGFELGKEDGYKDGSSEALRLVQRLQVLIERSMDKRAAILSETEAQVIELVLLISRKVVKVISESQKSIVIQNIIQALRKLKTKSDVIIRVNLSDLNIATEHIKDFINVVEQTKAIQIVEDSTVDKGGCIIETDFGEIDARILSQLNELEERILEIAPIRARGKIKAQ